MNKRIYILLVITLSSFKLFGNDDVKMLMQKANDSYTKGDYQLAVDQYEQIRAKGFSATELYYNLGNAYFKLKQLPAAILNYERALLIAPDDENIKYNLELSRTLIVDRIDQLPVLFITNWKNQVAKVFSPNVWAIMGLLAFIFTLALAIVFLYTQQSGLKKLSFWIAILFLLITIKSIWLGNIHAGLLKEQKMAIIFDPTVTVRSAPEEKSSELFNLHEGTKVKIEDQMNNWVEIRISDGNKGWIPASSIQKI